MPKVSQEHSDARRRQIIDAAFQCFARKGFHQTSMRDIYQQAGLSPGAVYHYFDSKDAIIQASFEFDYERSRDLFEAAAASDDPLKALMELLDFFFQGLKGAAELGAGRVVRPDERDFHRVFIVWGGTLRRVPPLGPTPAAPAK